MKRPAVEINLLRRIQWRRWLPGYLLAYEARNLIGYIEDLERRQITDQDIAETMPPEPGR